MTRLPLVLRCQPHPPLRLRRQLLTRSLRTSSMAAEAESSNPQRAPSEYTSETLQNYPIPLSPPPPLVSKSLELSRALTASSKSGLFSVSKEDVLFEDEWLIAVNKPQGIYCEAVLSSVRKLLLSEVSQVEQENILELHLSNRLDRDTSGVTLITRSHKMAAKLVKAFSDHKVKKTYIAFCIGNAPKWKNITIKSGHGRSRHGAWRVYAFSDVGRTLPGGSYVRDMETTFDVITTNSETSPLGFHALLGSETSCVEENDVGNEIIVVEEKSETTCDVEDAMEVIVRAYPKNGRTHQIRLHCQHLGIPLRGDVKYGGVYEWEGMEYEGHQLHAESLSFEHPITGQQVLIRAPLPAWAFGESG